MQAIVRDSVAVSPERGAESLMLTGGQICPVVDVDGERVFISINLSQGAPAKVIETTLANVILLHDDEMLVRFLLRSCGGGATVKHVIDNGGYTLDDMNAAAARGHVIFFSHDHGHKTHLTEQDDKVDFDVAVSSTLCNHRHGVLLKEPDADGRLLPLD